MPFFLAQESKGCDCIVLWLDCDKEGENICFEVLDAVAPSMRRLDKSTVFRAKFSSITDKDIVAAMNSLGEPDENQSKSVDARQELDLRVQPIDDVVHTERRLGPHEVKLQLTQGGGEDGVRLARVREVGRQVSGIPDVDCRRCCRTKTGMN